MDNLRGVYMEEYFWRLILPLIHTVILAVFYCVFFSYSCRGGLIQISSN